MLLSRLCTGEEVHFYKKSIVLFFNGQRKVLSTGPQNGGLRENLTAVFNNDGTNGAGMAADLIAPTYQEHVILLARRLGLDPDTASGITTAAQMENVAIKSKSYKDLTVTAIVTGGVEVNGGRAGDPAAWDEFSEEALVQPGHGTINIILHINMDLSEGALVRSLVTCTEAKTAALQELMAPSRYSMGLATGSGTDGTIIVANADSPVRLENAGKHVKLGELIGITVKEALKEALFLQTGLSAELQHSVLRRLGRFGITDDLLFERYAEQAAASLNKAWFEERLEARLSQGTVLTQMSLIAHLLDQMFWGLISPSEAMAAADVQLAALGMGVVGGTGAEDTTAALHQILAAVVKGLVAMITADASVVGSGDGQGDEPDGRPVPETTVAITADPDADSIAVPPVPGAETRDEGPDDQL
ncbi:MAG: adenosylcobinamide amidohydrolase [Actinomycetia bacterium]|nr:adenosylcobinamide amidohydrolase [Actinomycetes bacterium]